MTTASLKAVSECCSNNETVRRHRIHSRRPSLLDSIQWLLSATILLLMPKCPLCLAAYIAMGTGLGLSLTTAIYLRTSLLTAGGLSLAYLILRVIVRWRQRSQAPSPR